MPREDDGSQTPEARAVTDLRRPTPPPPILPADADVPAVPPRPAPRSDTCDRLWLGPLTAIYALLCPFLEVGWLLLLLTIRSAIFSALGLHHTGAIDPLLLVLGAAPLACGLYLGFRSIGVARRERSVWLAVTGVVAILVAVAVLLILPFTILMEALR